MKIFWLTVASLAALGIQPVLAYEARLPGQKDPGKNRAAQRGGEINQSRLTDPKNPLSRAQSTSTQPKPWEAKPWEQAQEDLRRDDLNAVKRKKWKSKRRVVEKARKERLARLKEDSHATSYGDRTKQRQTRWQRHQLQSDRYAPLTGTHPLCDKESGHTRSNSMVDYSASCLTVRIVNLKFSVI